MTTGRDQNVRAKRGWDVAYYAFLLVAVALGSRWAVSINPLDHSLWHWVRAIVLTVVLFSGVVWLGRQRRC